MDGGQAIQELAGQADRFGRRQRAAPENAAQVLPLDEFHDDPDGLALDHQVDYPDHVRVTDRRQH